MYKHLPCGALNNPAENFLTMSNISNRCAFGLHALSNNDLILTTQRIEDQLEKPVFASITPTPAEVRVVLDTFIELQQECAAGNRQRIAYRDKLRADLLKMLGMQFRGVNYFSQGNLEILGQSGFPIRRQPQAAQLPPEGRIKKIETGDNRGSFKVTLESWKGRKYYELEVTGANGVVRTYTSTKSKFLINDFPAGEFVMIATRMNNSAGFGPWSRRISYVVPAYSAVVTPPPTGDDNDKNMHVA